MRRTLERAAEHAPRATGQHDTGEVDSDHLGFLRKDLDAIEHTHDR